MNRKCLLGVGALIVLTACTVSSPTASPSASPSSSHPTTSPSPQLLLGCFGVWQGKNHYTLEVLSVTGSDFTGLMTYDNYQFDSSQGSFDGSVTSGTLFGVYRFIAEGSANERELIFRQSGDSLIQGFGEMKMVNGREVFEDITAVSWDPNFTYSRETTCPARWK